MDNSVERAGDMRGSYMADTVLQQQLAQQQARLQV